MSNWRRYEILLPLQFNDGKPVPKAVLAATVLVPPGPTERLPRAYQRMAVKKGDG